MQHNERVFIQVKDILQHPLFLLSVVIVGFLVALISLIPIRIDTMGTDPFFIFQITPLTYWLGFSVIVFSIFSMTPRLSEKRTRIVFIASCILLITIFRMIFAITFDNVQAYEGDSTNYLTVLSSWVNRGIDFGPEGAYQHNYPLCYLFAYAIVKLGVNLSVFYRFMPFIIYALDMLLLYLIIEEIMPENNKKSAIPLLSIFLFAFSSLGYWVTLHYCPDLFGTFTFLIALFFAIKFNKAEKWGLKPTACIFILIFLVILSHHLTTVYLVFTFFGLSLTSWFFKGSDFKKGALGFFILGIFTYTAWFAYGQLVYPSFFNVYSYFSGFSNVVQQSSAAGLSINLSFAIYPAFILILSAISFLKTMQIHHPILIFNYGSIKTKLRNIQKLEFKNTTFVFAIGFVLVFILFIIGLAVPVLFGTRIMEVLFIGMYPLASQTLSRLLETKSRRTRLLVYLVVFLVIIGSEYRYYSQIQRRQII